ncbi:MULTISPECIES: hypothetical protein [unclassified Microbacterium]|uniref:hypothetical protein n=1 Tax=unclassified Microbacterium TaxID=2609290 RepID=UPI000EA89EFE|nr:MULTISPECIES: hypothetical protein [unclassified Microbacterium]MBT2484845.1 hypothetical protein [Microbacterium sp. ISL-108]RKN67715.1 hypothetical protein D7252_09010 [Microbacterium sp. CGR2]
MPSRPDLEDNAEFYADLLDDELTRDAVCEKWNASAGYVSSRRRKAREAGVLTASSAAPGADGLLPGEENESKDTDKGKEFRFIRHRPVTLEDARELVRSSGDNPDLYNFAIRTIAYGIDQSSNKISAWPKTGIAMAEALPLEQLYAEARRIAESVTPVLRGPASGRSTVVVVADWQIGKTGRRGGTPELLARLTEARRKVDEELAKRAPESVLILDGGDGIEGFESGGNPMFTNDLSLPDQIACYATELLKFVHVAKDHVDDIEVGVVSSNHAAWRHGKQNLGNPSDDWGIHAHKRVQQAAEIAGIDATWHFPAEFDESLCVDFAGTPIGLVHGNQFAPGKAIDWWQGQTFGDQAVTRADVMVTAHYHSFGAGVAGQNPFTKRERFWVGAPTLDSGSDWYRNVKGRDSLPGTLIFDVTEDGFDLASLAIL